MIELPGYELLHELGSGGMARVYLALHKGLDRQVAIKLLNPSLSMDIAFSNRFLREARIVAKLNHPNIIAIFDVNVHQGYHYIAMEYLAGGSLGDKIKEGIAASQALSLLKIIVIGLKVAHDKGFVHRDIKPENILFRDDGTPVITDFGVARAELSATRMTAVGTIIGTPKYMSPEQAQGIEIKSNSDIYSLGIVFYEMLTGVLPYWSDSVVDLMYKHVNDPIPQLPEKLQLLQPLLNKLLAKKSKHRFQCASDVTKAIEQIELRVTAELSTLIKPPQESSQIFNSDKTRVKLQKKPVFKRVLQRKYVFAMATFVFVTAVGAVLFVSLSESTVPLPDEVANNTQDKQLASQTLLEEERLRQVLIAQEKLEQARVEAEKTELAKAQEALLREKTNKKHEIKQNILRHIANAEAAIKKNKLEEAHGFYQQILALDANNKAAKNGKNRVAGLYLGLALKKAKESEFDLAETYINNAAKISLRHPNLASVRQKVIDLKYQHRVRQANQSG